MGLIPKSELCNLPLTLLLILLFSSVIFSVSGEASEPTAYEILQKYGLPIGLLPDSVTSYSLSEDGAFEVHLEKPCYVQFDYLIYYEKKITGKLSIGAITELKGVQVRRFLFWFDVDEIKVDLPPSDNIYFTVGFINKKLDVDQFETVHSCRDETALCGQSLRNVFQLPTPVDDVQLLITE
ncbi:uncharacterized protein LOC113775744 [Coffea eugenioides]|uniref:uncharacterized protein LOC113775744 n=1 Tax=Coffea eugenioides TaxID=49369 RepID=UPI000F6064C1|nr:uncharacterized protein LOC113775744 [Coffea eugenioides]